MLDTFQKLLYNVSMKDGLDNLLFISHSINQAPMTFAFHSHDFYEVYFYLSGNATYYIENETYYLSQGDVLVVQPRKLHRSIIAAGEPYERFVLWIYEPCIASNEGIRTLLESISREIDKKNNRLASFEGHRLDIFKSMFERLDVSKQVGNEYSKAVCVGCVTLILDEILAKLIETLANAHEHEAFISRVISRINHDIVDAPSLDELSAEFNVSKYYLSHKFKEYTGTTIHQYILSKKINMAKELLDKKINPNEVCVRCGFSTYSNFYKAFINATGVAPKKYTLGS